MIRIFLRRGREGLKDGSLRFEEDMYPQNLSRIPVAFACLCSGIDKSQRSRPDDRRESARRARPLPLRRACHSDMQKGGKKKN